tara:strand:+ start:585 stop:800 length:216 start_codon:yes stop_codon:yes gene_type:complete
MEKKTARLEIRLTPQAKESIQETADEQGMTVSDFILQQCLSHPEARRCRFCFDPIEYREEKICECFDTPRK